jgi:hypothetical protein
MFDFCPGDCTEPVSVREKLLDLLEHTSSDVPDEMFPDVELSLDDIAGLLLDEHAHELAERIRNVDERLMVGYRDRDVLADLIDPEET